MQRFVVPAYLLAFALTATGGSPAMEPSRPTPASAPPAQGCSPGRLPAPVVQLESEPPPRIGHIHVTVDDAPWHWADASDEPLIINGMTPGPHRVLVELADPTHHIIDRQTVEFVVPPKPGA